MKHQRPACLALPLTCILLAGALSAQAEFRPAPIVFDRVSDTGSFGTVELAFDSEDFAAFLERAHGDRAFRVNGFPLPGGKKTGLELRPVSAMPQGARAQIIGEGGHVIERAPRVACFSGVLDEGGPIFLGLTRNQAHGYLYLDGELYFLASQPGARAGHVTLAHSSQVGTLDAGGCQPGKAPLEFDLGLGDTLELIGAPTLRTADVFVEVDNAFRARFTSDQECIDYAVLLFTAASEIYRRDLGVELRIPNNYLRVWNTTPPWGAITGFSNLKNVYNYWLSNANPLKSLPRAAVHVLTYPIFGGTSRGVDGICDNVRAYEISSVGGRFPYPAAHTSRYNWDLFVVCHELGHTFGSPHSSLYTPPIECQDGSGPDSGTIMSYCHTTFGIAQVGMRFHAREQTKIRKTIENKLCPKSRPIQMGDYDGDGDLDSLDLTALRAVRAQGFRSIAAEEVLDMDLDGDIDESDHDFLAERVYGAPPARASVRNGLGMNPQALVSLSAPVLGTSWRSQIAAPLGSSTLLVGYDLPNPGVTTSRGELLVSTTPYGGTKLFASTVVVTGSAAIHEIPLPVDASLLGKTISFQGLVSQTGSADFYTNALDVLLSTWE
ncbi:MAG: M12 family metallo-peptidase [Planctomycetota bacterium]